MFTSPSGTPRIRDNLWPWLRERQYAGPEDDQQLDAFLERLGRRDAHLRPGIEVRRIWPWPHAADLDERGTLASEVRTAVAQLLTALDEPLPQRVPQVRVRRNSAQGTVTSTLAGAYCRLSCSSR